MRKILITALILASVTSASAEIDFRSDQPIDFYNPIDLNNNEIRNFFNQSCGRDQAVKDVYNNGTFECAPAGGLDTAVEVNNTLVKNIDANGYQITNLGPSNSANDAARYGEVLKLEGDTMRGPIDMNGYNINGVDQIQFESGFNIEGDLNTSGGDINLDNGLINNVSDPLDSNDAVPRSYIDSRQYKVAVNSTSSGYYLGTGSQSGAIQTNNELTYESDDGNIILGVQTSELNHNSLNAISYDDHHGVGNGLKWDANNSIAIANNAVEGTELASQFETGSAFDSRFIQVSGDTLSGNLSMNSYYIKNLADPVSAQDAATKSYVDNNDDTGTDSQTLSTTADTSGTNDEITISNGNTITVDDDFEANTDAATKCNNDQILEGSDNCVTNYEASDDGDTDSSNEIQSPTVTTNDDQVTVSLNNGGNSDSASIVDDNTQLDDQPAQSDVNMNGNAIDDAGKIGVNTQNPTQNLDVDGNAEISSSGSSMEMKSNGNVVITLG